MGRYNGADIRYPPGKLESHQTQIGNPKRCKLQARRFKRGVVKVRRCERPSDLEVSGHSLRVGAAQDLLIKGYDLAAIVRAGGWSDPSTVSRYLQFSRHNIWR